MTQKRAETRSPRSVVTVQRLVASSKAAAVTRVVELDVAAQVEAVGDVVDVAQDLRLGGVALGPVPLLLELVGERVRVVQALDVAARARVAVPVPGAADAVAGLVDARREPEPRRRWSMYSPAKPAPTMTASKAADGAASASIGCRDRCVSDGMRTLLVARSSTAG